LPARRYGLIGPDSIGFGGVFPYMGLAIPSHALEASAHAANPDEYSQFF
jgi:hypothetical protein